MIQHYLKYALKKIKNNTLSSVINIIGITLAITFCLFVCRYILYETSYDRFHKNANNIYRKTGTTNGRELIRYEINSRKS